MEQTSPLCELSEELFFEEKIWSLRDVLSNDSLPPPSPLSLEEESMGLFNDSNDLWHYKIPLEKHEEGCFSHSKAEKRCHS